VIERAAEDGRLAVVAGELVKLPAFVRRDFLIAWSYRVAFVGDLVGLVFGLIVFYFVGKMIDPATVPAYAGNRPSYLEWVVVGVAMGAFVSLGLGRVMAAIRSEQMTGTLESLLMTPTSTATVQVGSAIYDLVYVPIRTALFLVLAAILFDLDYAAGGILRAAMVLVAFVPFVWGLGILSAAGVLTLRRGAGIVGVGTALLTLASGAYFPIALLPDWIEATADFNPIAVALEGMREALIGGATWSDIASDIAVLVPAALIALAVGIAAFKIALRRERRKGTMGLY
jgi:ABC-2 type transport system permease protein